MATAQRKTLEELQAEVEKGLGLTSDEDLKALFDDVDLNTPGQTTPANPPAQHAGSQATQSGNVTPATGQPVDVLTHIPEEFRDKDVPTSLGKMTKSISETRSAMSNQAKELQELRDLVESLRQPASAVPHEPQPHRADQPQEDPDEDIDDSMIIEKPKEMIKKLAQREAARIAIAALTQYDTAARRERAIEAFRTSHPDFDGLRDEMGAVVKEYPQLNRDPNALPKIYDLAKKRAEKKMEALRVSMGATSTPINEEEIIAKAVDRIKQEVAKRRSASGTLPAGQGVSPDQRVTSPQRTIQKTPDEQLFDEILNSGPAKLTIE